MSQLTIETQLPSSISAKSNRISGGRIFRIGLLAMVLAVIANYIVLTVVVNALALPDSGAMNPTLVIGLTAVGVLLAMIVFAIVRRVAKNPARVFGFIAVAALILSFVPNILTLTGTMNVARTLGIGGGGRGQRAGQQQGTGQDTGTAPTDNASAANAGAISATTDAGGQTGAQAGIQQGRRGNGQGFNAQRVPMQLSLMTMHLVAFAICMTILTRVATASAPARKID